MMSTAAFKIANKLLTGQGAVEQLAHELSRLNIHNPLIVTDAILIKSGTCLLYTSPSPRDRQKSRMPSSA